MSEKFLFQQETDSLIPNSYKNKSLSEISISVYNCPFYSFFVNAIEMKRGKVSFNLAPWDI